MQCSSSSSASAAEQRRGQRLHALDRDALGQLVQDLGQLGMLARPARRPGARTAGVSSSSRQGGAHSRGHRLDGALVGDGEGADLLHLVAPELDPGRVLVGRREDVEDAAADGELAPLGDQVDPGVRQVGQPAGDLLQLGLVADGRAATGSRSPRPLSCGWSTRAHRRDDDPQRTGGSSAVRVREPAQHGEPPADGVGAGREPLVRQRLPGREDHHLLRRQQAAQRGGEVVGLPRGRGHRQHRPARPARLLGRRPRRRRRTAAATAARSGRGRRPPSRPPGPAGAPAPTPDHVAPQSTTRSARRSHLQGTRNGPRVRLGRGWRGSQTAPRPRSGRCHVGRP